MKKSIKKCNLDINKLENTRKAIQMIEKRIDELK
jgi:hypothetical protein